MKQIKDESIDVVNTIELFEHVEFPEKGLRECYRVLTKGRVMIVSVLFLYPIHADPLIFKDRLRINRNNFNSAWN